MASAAWTDMFSRLESTSVATAIRESTWLFPTVETLHVLSIVLVVGSIMIVDLRLINVASRRRAVSELMNEVLPWTWLAFFCALITGSLLFSSAALKYIHAAPFRAKMVLLLFAGINMAIFHLGSYRKVALWDRASMTPTGARVAGALSLAIWVTVIACGRWIGFVTN
ncbi:MAG TPA: DUF6644 family protein [Steroidobacteraceae bacterium]|nr:DUF6644 family protein [Steroidobacteraceae bacterium]